LAATEQVFRKLEAGFRIEEIAAAEARLEAARAETAAIEAQLAELTVSSPCDCLIEATDLRPGDLVSPNAPSVALLDLSRLWVRAYVPENRLGQVRIGDTVSVRVDSFHDRLFDGRVTFLSSEAEFTPQNVQTPEERSKQVFRIKVAIDEGKQDLRVGMWADVLMDRTEAR
jgi:multidrug resistance efflux pump